MPSLSFVLPHWLYWSGLLLFPLGAMWMVRRQERRGRGGGVTLPIAYVFWVSGGFVGIHRFYLRDLWGAVYIPLFVLVLAFNVQERDARQAQSNASNEVSVAEFMLERAQCNVEQGRAAPGDVAEARTELEAAREAMRAAEADYRWWNTVIGSLAGLIAVLLLIDAVLLPRMTRRCAQREGHPAPRVVPGAEEAPQSTAHEDPSRRVRRPLTDWIDRLSGFTGEFVAYWSILAVFIYYYEVIARYVFNSPTNWAHESMFLMFGMQYLISGAFALREDAHVRVDVVYLMMPERVRALTDVITSLAFFLFTGALAVTGWLFAMDAVEVWEVSFTEWAIQYWPVKLAIPLGAGLIFLQGVSKLIKDMIILLGKEA